MFVETKGCGSVTSAKIDITDEHQCRFWAGRFGVTREELVGAVERVGAAAYDVEWDLGEREPSNRHLWSLPPPAVAAAPLLGIGSMVSSGSVLFLQVAVA